MEVRSDDREPHTVGRDERDMIGVGQRDERLVVDRLVPQQMSLELDIDLRPAKQPDEPIEQPPHPVAIPHERRATGERHEPGGEPVEIVQRQDSLALGRVELHASQQPAQVPISLRRLDQHRQTPETHRR